MKRLLGTLTLILCGLAAVGCNTVAGMGRDISKAGDTIEDAAKKR